MLFSLIILIQGNDLSLNKYIYIFLISFFSNTFSAIAGGGAGLIQLPALILAGVPYYQALSCHKIATVALGIGSSLRNFKFFRYYLGIIMQILIFGLPGVVVGTSIVQYISEEYLFFLLGSISMFLAFLSFSNSEFGLVSEGRKLNFSLKFKFVIITFLIGILNGSISSGTGLLMTILLMKIHGMDFLKSVSLTFFAVGIFWNAAGGILLSKNGIILTNLLIILIMGSFFGGLFGAHLSNLKGNKLIKNTFNVVCFSVGVSLLIKAINIYFFTKS